MSNFVEILKVLILLYGKHVLFSYCAVFLFFCVKKAIFPSYFPKQNLENILLIISSETLLPVISPSSSNTFLISIAIISIGKFCSLRLVVPVYNFNCFMYMIFVPNICNYNSIVIIHFIIFEHVRNCFIQFIYSYFCPHRCLYNGFI